MIHEIQIPPELFETFTALDRWGEKDITNRITKVSKLNVFVGPNNTGKSRLIRALFSSGDLTVAGQTQKTLRKAQNDILDFLRQHPLPQLGYDKHLRELRTCHPYLLAFPGASKAPASKSPEQTHLRQRFTPHEEAFRTHFGAHYPEFKHLFDTLYSSLEDPPPRRVYEEQQILRFYIPSLRGLRTLNKDNNVYRERTVADYFSGHGSIKSADDDLKQATILTGLELYKVIQSHLLGPPEQRQLIIDFEAFISELYFGNKPITLMPRIDRDMLWFGLGGEEERTIAEIGDGIQHMIIQTLPIFLHRDKPMMLFIEEPELFLHPGFQRALIDTFLNRSGDEHQIFVATHSHQFLDITIDSEQCTVYRCRKTRADDADPKSIRYEVALTSAGDFAVLNELGVRNSAVFLSNCTIWVEGITDRRYYRHYLQLYQNDLAEKDPAITHFLEDLHFSFVEYSGSNITHWSFLDGEDTIDIDRLCGQAMVICDRDEKKDERHETLKRILGDRFIRLSCLEVENLLTRDTLCAAITRYEGCDVTFKEFEESHYQNERLGTFIESAVLPDGFQSSHRSKHNHPYAAESGTLKDVVKKSFCDHALGAVKRIEDMSDEARCIARRLYDFIAKKNK